MATVYLAEDERHHRSVAIKVLHPELVRALGVERFGREIGIAARLNHPNIVPLLDSGVVQLDQGAPAAPYYVMPLVEGESLRNLLTRTPQLPLQEALRLTCEVAGALDYAHRAGVVHRDIKPENVLLADGHAVVSDFGLARALGESGAATITQAGQALGTPQYMSPEQITGETVPDGRSDIYSLGCVLFEMLAGRPPGNPHSVQALLAQRLSSPPPSVRELNRDVPEAVATALLCAMAVEPARRFATAGEFAGALSVAISGVTGAATRGGSTARSRWRLPLLAGVAIAIAAVIFAATRLSRTGSAEVITSIAIAPEPTDSATEYLSAGVHEAVADLLRRLPRLRVTAPSLVAQVSRQQPGLNAEELGQRLNVGAILTWALRRTGDSVQVRTELLRIPGGELMWSARYARPFTEVMSLQGEIARAISDSLRLQLSEGERVTLGRRPTANAAAYNYYLLGKRALIIATPVGSRGAPEMMDSAAYYARRALEVDSSFAGAWALLGEYHLSTAFRGYRAPFAAEVETARQLAVRAIALDSTSGGAWQSLAALPLYIEDDFAKAKQAFDLGGRLAPTDAALRHFHAVYLAEFEGRLDSAIAESRYANELGMATFYLNTLGDLYMRKGQYDSAIAVLRRAIDLDPAASGPQLRLVTSYERSGRYPEAVAARRAWRGEAAALAFERGLATGGVPGYRAALTAELRLRADSLKALIGGPRVYPRDTVPLIPEARLALLYGQLGEWKTATDWVLREHKLRPRRLVFWVKHPDMEGLKLDPRFLAIARAAGLLSP
jgi:serine/threonine-protein kinase